MIESTCDLSDTYGELARIVSPGLRHFGGKRRFNGAVATVKCFEDNSRVRELVTTPGDGRVLLVDGGGSTRYALLGDMLGREALAHGWAGVVVYGCVRDTSVLETLKLGVMALAATPRRSLKNGEGTVGVPIEIAGTPCRPGDLLFADDDGIVVIDPAVIGTAVRG
jgi:regulator of ribonuclease activity A